VPGEGVKAEGSEHCEDSAEQAGLAPVH
jgi:hypothetical protein